MSREGQARVREAVRRDEIRRFNRQCPLDYESYRRYLRSSHWQAVRTRIRRRAGDCCEGCGAPSSSGQLEVHHLTYERLGSELDSDLQLLCQPCHLDAHEAWDPFEQAVVDVRWGSAPAVGAHDREVRQ